MSKDFVKIYGGHHVEELSEYICNMIIDPEDLPKGELVQLYEHLKRELLNKIHLELYNIFYKPEIFSIVAKDFIIHDQNIVPYEDLSKMPVTLQKELFGDDIMLSDEIPETAWIGDKEYIISEKKVFLNLKNIL